MPTTLSAQVPNAIQRIANAPDRRLAWEFFVLFSRFEYALKRDTRYLMAGTGDAQPNWDRFASDNNDRFTPESSTALREALDYYLANPPRKQLRNNGAMNWSVPQSWDGREPQLIWLLRVIRTVRNNLFHGGKFPLMPVSEVSRDQTLINHGVSVLAEALELDSRLTQYFLEGFVRPNNSVKLSANGVPHRPSSAGPAAYFALAVQRDTPLAPAYLKR